MTKTTKAIKFSTYQVNICTDMGYIFMMTKNKSVKQININKNVLNDYQIYWKRSQHIHGLKTIISFSLSLILVRCTKTGYDVTCSKNGVTCKHKTNTISSQIGPS